MSMTQAPAIMRPRANSFAFLGDSITHMNANTFMPGTITSTTAGASSFVLSNVTNGSWSIQPGDKVWLANGSSTAGEVYTVANSWVPGSGSLVVPINGTISTAGRTIVWYYNYANRPAPQYAMNAWIATALNRCGWPLELLPPTVSQQFGGIIGLPGAQTSHVLGQLAYTDPIQQTATTDWLAQVLALTDPLTGAGADYIHVLLGTNDILKNPAWTAAQIAGQATANLATIIARIIQAGRTPIVGTLPPINFGLTNAQFSALGQINAFIRRMAYDGRIILVDYNRFVSDPVSGLWLAGSSYGIPAGVTFTSDGVHPDTWSGAWAMASALIAGLQAAGISVPQTYSTGDFIANASSRVVMGVEPTTDFDLMYSSTFGTNPRGNLVQNGQLGVTGYSVPKYWGGSGLARTPANGSATLASVARGNTAGNPFDRGYCLQATYAQGTGADYGSSNIVQTDVVSANSQALGPNTWQAGDVITLQMAMHIASPGGSNNFFTSATANVLLYNGATQIGQASLYPGSVTSGHDPSAMFGTAILRAPPFVVPVGCTAIKPQVYLSGVGTISVTDLEVRKRV